MRITGKKIIVIGGGIGGLAAALALARLGAVVTVLEQTAEISDMGAGLQISPNGFVVLDALGLRDAVVDRSVAATSVVLRNYSNSAMVATLDVSPQTGGQNYHFIHRADLVACLLSAARQAGVQVRLQHKVKQVQTSVIPQVVLTNGATMMADLVVGADGLHSCLRPVLNRPAAPRFTGQVAWRALVPRQSDALAQVQLYMGPGRHLVTYPLRGGQLVNVVAVQERTNWAADGWQHRDDPQNLRRAFADFSPDVQELLRSVDNLHLWGLFRHPVVRNWYQDHAVLLGDAAHPTLPFLAQGANMALEDAWVLADCLANAETTSGALARYQKRREGRVRRVIAVSGRNAWKYHLRLPPLRMAAHAALRFVSLKAPQYLTRQFDWLYHHDVTKHS
ncbi:FAD-dependent monooxygenase [Paracoccaceae bacterium]|nr:FAD-dependent monooxygenase [Paracoccaceae bacterium]